MRHPVRRVCELLFGTRDFETLAASVVDVGCFVSHRNSKRSLSKSLKHDRERRGKVFTFLHRSSKDFCPLLPTSPRNIQIQLRKWGDFSFYSFYQRESSKGQINYWTLFFVSIYSLGKTSPFFPSNPTWHERNSHKRAKGGRKFRWRLQLASG